MVGHQPTTINGDKRMTAPLNQRREFLGKLAAGAVAIGVGSIGARSAFASTMDAHMPPTNGRRTGLASPKPSDHWLSLLTGTDRQVFDIPDHLNGMGLLHVRNYMDTYRDFYHLTHPTVTAVVTLYGNTTMLAFNDAMWKKYDLGKPTKVMDRSNAAATSNVFYKAPSGSSSLSLTGAPMPIPADASIADLQSRGAIFLLCNNAFHAWMGLMASKAGSSPDALASEFLDNVLPGVELVPAMVIAISQAQKHGCTYMRVS
jgi:hypothetical protein